MRRRSVRVPAVPTQPLSRDGCLTGALNLRGQPVRSRLPVREVYINGRKNSEGNI
jgi:hypothetical protein